MRKKMKEEKQQQLAPFRRIAWAEDQREQLDELTDQWYMKRTLTQGASNYTEFTHILTHAAKDKGD